MALHCRPIGQDDYDLLTLEAFTALAINGLSSMPIASVMRNNVSIVGSRSCFSTRITIVWLSPARVATSLSESF